MTAELRPRTNARLRLVQLRAFAAYPPDRLDLAALADSFHEVVSSRGLESITATSLLGWMDRRMFS
jgi:hypothetical protein